MTPQRCSSGYGTRHVIPVKVIGGAEEGLPFDEDPTVKNQRTPKTRPALLPLIPLLAAACANTVHRETVVDAPLSDAWRVLAEEFSSVDKWASSIPKSYATNGGPALQGAPSHGRVCETPLGSATETITRYDERGHVLAYEAKVDTFPFFVSGLSNQWTLIPEGPNRTRIVMDFDADLWPVFNVVMWPFMKGRLVKLLDESTEELETYLETGAIHQRKVAALAEASAAKEAAK